MNADGWELPIAKVAVGSLAETVTFGPTNYYGSLPWVPSAWRSPCPG